MKQHKKVWTPTCQCWLAWLSGAIVFAVALPGSATEKCSGGNKTHTFQLPATITSPSNAVIGTLLTSWFTSPELTLICSASNANGVRIGAIPMNKSQVQVKYSDGLADITVWDTGVSGVGLAIASYWFADPCGTFFSKWFTIDDLTVKNTVACNGGPDKKVGAKISVALVKTGRIAAGKIDPLDIVKLTPIGRETETGTWDIISSSRITLSTSRVTITAPTCQITTPAASINLTQYGSLSTSSFTGINSTSSPAPFQLGLNCADSLTRLAITFTDVGNPANRTSILPLSDDSTASGLGVQILNNNSPVRFGPDSENPGNPGQVAIPLAVGGTNRAFNLPFTARYIQTNNVVTPGNAKARASFTFSYN